jgi:hypothetical protein
MGHDAGPDWNVCTDLGVLRTEQVVAGLALMR